MPRRALSPLNPDLSRPAGALLPLPRSRDRRHRLRPHLLAPQEDQFLHVVAGQTVGIKEVDDAVWLVSFMFLRRHKLMSSPKLLAEHYEHFEARLAERRSKVTRQEAA